MSHRDNVLKSIRFEQPDYIPMVFAINGACWNHYDPSVLQDLMEAHPFLFPGFVRQEKVMPEFNLAAIKNEPYTDQWGCHWCTTEDGITGSVHGHPLAGWAGFDTYLAPDPNSSNGIFPIDWTRIRSDAEQLRASGSLVTGGLPHGHTFLRLQDILGYEQLLFDMMDEEPRLNRLLEMVEDFNFHYVQRWIELAPDMMAYPEDLGMQVGPMLSPEHFRRYIKPVYQRIMKPARDKGCIVHMHSDGDIRTLVDDLIEGGVDVINLQDLVNGLDWIEKKFAGRVCIDLDIDRQRITARGTPRQIDELIHDEVKRLGSKKGGLMMIYGLYPGVPLENVKALMDAMEKYSTYHA